MGDREDHIEMPHDEELQGYASEDDEVHPIPIYVWTDFKEAAAKFHAIRGELQVWAGEELLYESGLVSTEDLMVQLKLFRWGP